MMRKIVALSALLLSLGTAAQTYRPEGRAIVSVNGQNRFTRALYCGPTTWRVMTSDRPVFNLGTSSAGRTMLLRINGVSLEATDYCESRYEDGMRSYVLRHKTWGPKAVVRLKMVPLQTEELVLCRILTSGFDAEVNLLVTAGRPDQPVSATFEDECYVCFDKTTAYVADARQCSDRFEDAEAAMTQLAGQIVISTPEPYLNTLGGALSIAARAMKVSLDKTPAKQENCTSEEAWEATKFMDRDLPRIPLSASLSSPSAKGLALLANSNKMPYVEGKHNVVTAQNMRAALTYFHAGRSEEGYRLMLANVTDQMYEDLCPANFGLLSKYDPTRKECRLDEPECIAATVQTLTEGLFGIRLEDGKCIIRPGFPESWDSASIRTPYIDYSYRRIGEEALVEVTQHWAQPRQVVIRQNLGIGKSADVAGTGEAHQVIRMKVPVGYPEVTFRTPDDAAIRVQHKGTDEPTFAGKFNKLNMDRWLTGRLSTLTTMLPNVPASTGAGAPSVPTVDDSAFRSLLVKDEFIAMGIPFRTKAEGYNIAFTALGEAYPDSLTIPVSGKYQRAWLLMAGTTGYSQSRITNAVVVASYQDGTSDTLRLVNPDNWCPVECDYYIDGVSFQAAQPRPYRVLLSTGQVSRNLGRLLGIEGVSPRLIPGGAAQMLCLPLDYRKKLLSLSVRPQVEGVVVGLMAVTLQD